MTPVMLRALVVIVLLCAPIRSWAAAPETLSGTVYVDYAEMSSAGTPARIARIARTDAILLKPDGTYQWIYGASGTGSWTYRKTGPNTGALEMDAGDSARTRQLVFRSDTEGTWSGFGLTFGAAEIARFTMLPFRHRSSLVNASSRAFVRAGTSASLGFVIADPGALVLVRAVGPGLARFGVTGPMPQPIVTVLSSGVSVCENRNWTTTANTATRGMQVDLPDQIRGMSAFAGAFPLFTESADAAIVTILGPGAYVAEVGSADASASGEVLLEVYSLP
jgi:hypothetical protein